MRWCANVKQNEASSSEHAEERTESTPKDMGSHATKLNRYKKNYYTTRKKFYKIIWRRRDRTTHTQLKLKRTHNLSFVSMEIQKLDVIAMTIEF